MRFAITLILALAAVLSFTAGSYHNPGFKFWASGSYTISIETQKPLQMLRVIAYQNDIKVVALPSFDQEHGAANGDTLTVPTGTFTPVWLGNSQSVQIIRDGGATEVLAQWGGN